MLTKTHIFVVIFFLLFASYSLYLIPKYGLDTFGYMNFAGENIFNTYYKIHHLNHGRPVNVLFDYISMKLGIGANYQAIVVFITILSLSLLFLKTVLTFLKYNLVNASESLNYLVILAFYPIYANVFLSEFFCFPEIMISLLILFWILIHFSAIWIATRPLNLKNILISAIFFIVAFNTYQSAGALFFLLLLIFVFIKPTLPTQNDINRFLVGCVVFIFAVITNLAFIKIVADVTSGRAVTMFQSFDYVKIMLSVRFLKSLFIDTYGLMPKYFFIGTILIVFTLLVVLTIRLSATKLHKAFFVILPVFLSLISVAVLFAPQFVTQPWQAPRTMFTMPGVLTFFALVLVLILSKENSNSHEKVTKIILFVFVLISVLSINKMAASFLAQNQADRIEAIQLVNTIQRYESENNVAIAKIYFIRENPTWSAIKEPLFSNIYDYNQRGLTVAWNGLNIIKFYTGRQFVYSYENLENVKEKVNFTGKPAYIMHEVIIQGDTAYIKIY